jgi:adenine-specific DNA glycosylase
VARRPVAGLFGGLWGPPCAEVGSGEAPGRTLVSELRRSYGLRLAAGEELAACERTLTHRRLTLRAFRCEPRGRIREGSGLRFADPDALARLGVPTAIRDLLSRL